MYKRQNLCCLFYEKKQCKGISDILTIFLTRGLRVLVAGDWLNRVGFRFSPFKEIVSICDVTS